MTRAIIIAVLAGIIVSGLEGAAEAAGPGAADEHEHGHELHGPIHVTDHDHGDDADHDDHFCHCGVHTAALISTVVMSTVPRSALADSRHNDRFTSFQSPPLLRPPNA